MNLPPSAARASPATARNRDPILMVLKPRLPEQGEVLEIAAGAGEHAVYLAAAMPGLEWRPTDADASAVASIRAWRELDGPANLLEPLRLDAAQPDHWPLTHADAIVCINMVHISPWATTCGLLAGAARVLRTGGLLYLYGPYLEEGVETAPTNLMFDQDLRRRDPAWGLRHRSAVEAEAGKHGLTLEERIAMPANNLSLFFRKA